FEARREVLILQKASLLTTQKRGNQTIVGINAQCPYLQEIKSLYLKTEGIFAQLKNSLSKFKNIRLAFIYGSMASGKDTPKSDIDLLIIGGADEKILAKEIFKIQRKTTREINYNLWSETDFAKKAKEKGAFLAQIAKGKKVFLVGSKM
ncbi:MAG: nucleotidyltransferase domain-containing protein, partial [Candidatus Micrarchaeota archaeon]